ncbi:MAG: UDP-2,3-diacylglucosamine diphosphatase [Gemmatimonadota bacterium]|nr:MAG: UDP-2,3-diacylglucosamine diphosphatase [Gemmatimonadota bacterium]
MSADPVVIVSDVHLGYAPPEIARAFHRFLERVPDLGCHLVVNGDLFEFWFEYREVIPRAAFPTLQALGRLRRAGVRLTVTGGNHDRWGGTFWRDEVDAAFHPGEVELDLAGHRALVTHGDGIGDGQWHARALHSVVRHPLTARLFRWMHPDLGIALVRRVSPLLSGKARDESIVRRHAEAQAAHARTLLGERDDLALVVMGHTHRAALEQVAPGRWYLNPGAFLEGLRYAVVERDGPRMERFATSTG